LWLHGGVTFIQTASTRFNGNHSGKYSLFWLAASSQFYFMKHSTCANHKAVNQANANRRNLEATGVGACACARHGCFVPHSVVDFQKGERLDHYLVSLAIDTTNI
jgi:Kyakuja-Dileera-Zisupton transposase